MTKIVLLKRIKLSYDPFCWYIRTCILREAHQNIIDAIQNKYRGKTVYTNIFKAKIK